MKLLTKFLLLLLVIGSLATQSIGQDLTKTEQQFLKAYTSGSNMVWKISLQQLEDATDEPSQLLLAKGYYAAAGTAMGTQEKDLASDLLDKSAILTRQLLANNEELAEAHALLSSVYGMKMGLSPMKGMILGSKCNSAAEKAIQLAPNNGFTNYVKGSNLFYTPAMFGGDIEKSIEFLKKAKSIYEQAQQTNSWEYVNMMTLLGQVYHKEKKYEEAESLFTAVLQIVPTYRYVKNYLLPKTQKAKS